MRLIDVFDVLGAVVTFPLVSAALVGASVRRWWAPGLPLLVLPVLALPWGYTDGAALDYGIGFFVGVGFVALSVPTIALAGLVKAG